MMEHAHPLGDGIIRSTWEPNTERTALAIEGELGNNTFKQSQRWLRREAVGTATGDIPEGKQRLT